jgi:hypothetical protein
MILAVALPVVAGALDKVVPKPPSNAVPSAIVIGFVGGFVSHKNQHHGPVILAQQIRRAVPNGTYVQVFENRRRRDAFDTVLRLLDGDHDGVLSSEEKGNARIVLFGHSWGAVVKSWLPIPLIPKSSATIAWITRKIPSSVRKPPGGIGSSPQAICRANVIPTFGRK